jgi:hypothetical protein
MDLITDYRARQLHDDGMTFRDIARNSGISLTRIRAAVRQATPGPISRELRDEIRAAGGIETRWQDR